MLTTDIDRLHKDWQKEAAVGSRRLHQILMEFAHDGDSLDDKCQNLYRSQILTNKASQYVEDFGDLDSDSLTDKTEGLSLTSGPTEDSIIFGLS